MSAISFSTGQSSQLSSSGARLLNLLKTNGETQSTSSSQKSASQRPSGSPPGPPPSGPPPGSGMGSDAQSLFEALASSDTDGSGTLSTSEIDESAASTLLSDAFGLVDADGNGQLDAAEVGSYETAVNAVLQAAGSAVDIAGLMAGMSASDDAATSGPGGAGGPPPHGPPPDGPPPSRSAGGVGMDETTATSVAEALTAVLEAMDEDADGSLSGSDLASGLAKMAADDSATQTGSLAETIVKAMASQVENSTDTDALAQRYSQILQALKG
jgi:Ca2+-binding EF-hand superfamily protein